MNRVVKAILSKISEPVTHEDWVNFLERVEYSINNTVHSTTKETPSKLLFGVAQRGEFIDRFTEYLETKVANIRQSFEVLRSSAAKNLKNIVREKPLNKKGRQLNIH